MIIEKIKALESARARIAALETAIAEERAKELAALPAQFGFESAEAFLAAVHEATGAAPRRGGRAKAAAKPAKSGKRKRARITDETRESVKKLVADGKSGNAIAKELGISLPSVQNIKKVLGLVKKRKG